MYTKASSFSIHRIVSLPDRPDAKSDFSIYISESDIRNCSIC